jgi:hypothetical protein
MAPRLLCFLIVLCGSACSSQAAQGPRPRSPFTADDAALFEDGIDLIENPDQLEGQWKTDWDRDLDRRIAQSDFVALGSVTTLRDDSDLESRTSYQIVLAIERTLAGDAHGSELTLISRQGSGGYSSVEKQRKQLLGRKLTAFVKYAAGDGDSVVSHFHLSAPSSAVLERVGASETRKHPTSVQVIEHRD